MEDTIGPVGICGAIESGKDTVAGMLCALNPFIFQRYALADPIRRIAREFGFTDEQLTDHGLKGTVDPYWGITPRKFLQLVGTEMFRDHLDQRVWIRLAERELHSYGPGQTLVISDIRFPDEARWIRSCGGLVVRVLRQGQEPLPTEVTEHASERGIPDDLVDIELMNNGGLEDLTKVVRTVLLPLVKAGRKAP